MNRRPAPKTADGRRSEFHRGSTGDARGTPGGLPLRAGRPCVWGYLNWVGEHRFITGCDEHGTVPYPADGKCPKSRFPLPPPFELERGGIVGSVEVTDCVDRSDSPWFFGPFGFVLRDPIRLVFEPCRGALGFFKVQA